MNTIERIADVGGHSWVNICLQLHSGIGIQLTLETALQMYLRFQNNLVASLLQRAIPQELYGRRVLIWSAISNASCAAGSNPVCIESGLAMNRG